MPRKKKNGAVQADGFAVGLAALFRPVVEPMVREIMAEIFSEWVGRNATAKAVVEGNAASPEQGVIVVRELGQKRDKDK